MTNQPLCVRVASAPAEKPRRWTLREDNHSQHHGIVNLSESPLCLELWCRESLTDPPHFVGSFQLDLTGLLDGGFIRREPSGHSGNVRLRIFKADDGHFYIQTNDKGPRLSLDAQ
jgi:hypothetical protein